MKRPELLDWILLICLLVNIAARHDWLPRVDPTPGPRPTPDDVTPDDPNADGVKRVLIVYESEDRGKYPASQTAIFSSAGFREWLRDRVSVDADGNAEFRIWDKDADLQFVPDAWQAAMQAERKSLPWIWITDGKKSWGSELPESVEATQELIGRYLK